MRKINKSQSKKQKVLVQIVDMSDKYIYNET